MTFGRRAFAAILPVGTYWLRKFAGVTVDQQDLTSSDRLCRLAASGPEVTNAFICCLLNRSGHTGEFRVRFARGTGSSAKFPFQL